MPTIVQLRLIVRDGSGITGVQVRDNSGAVSACECHDLAKLFAEDLYIMSGMPSDGAAGKTGKRERIAKAIPFQLTNTLKLLTHLKGTVLMGCMNLIRFLKQI